jgi:hypothetical protein
MQARSNRPATAPLELKAFYSITMLARASGVTYHFMRRLLEANGVTFIRSNRAIIVPLSEIRSRAPVVWNSLTALESLRSHAASSPTANANKDRASRSKSTASRSEHTVSGGQLPAASSSHPAPSRGNTDEDPERSA